MKKRNKKLMFRHEIVFRCDSADVGEIRITKHSDCKTGVTMYSIDLNGEFCVFCDNFIFLVRVIESDPNLIGHVLCNLESED